MARYIGESCRVCRREGEKLFLKGSRCYTDKCALTRRAYAPGQHGQKRKKQSDYGMQLREKQKAKAFYGVLESQFRKYFEEASRSKEVTGLKLLQILESRLDNVVYRLGLATSRAQARQLVRHGHFTVNGKKVIKVLIGPFSGAELNQKLGQIKADIDQNAYIYKIK